MYCIYIALHFFVVVVDSFLFRLLSTNQYVTTTALSHL